MQLDQWEDRGVRRLGRQEQGVASEESEESEETKGIHVQLDDGPTDRFLRAT